MNRSTVATIFLGGFLTGGVMAASLGASVKDRLNVTVSNQERELVTLRTEVTAMHSRLHKLFLRVEALAIKWERDLETARGRARIQDDGTID